MAHSMIVAVFIRNWEGVNDVCLSGQRDSTVKVLPLLSRRLTCHIHRHDYSERGSSCLSPELSSVFICNA